MGRLLSDSPARAESRGGLQRARHECPAHDAGPLAADHGRERAASRTKGNEAHEAMEAATHERERQEEARLVHEQKCQHAAVQTTTASSSRTPLRKLEHTARWYEALETRVAVAQSTKRAEWSSS